MQYDNTNSDDNEVPNADGIGVCDGPRSSSQTMDFDSTEDEEPHFYQSSTKSMEATREEQDTEQAMPNTEAHVLALERESFQGQLNVQ